MKARKRKDIIIGVLISTVLVLLLVKSQSSFYTKQMVTNEVFDFGYNAAVLDQLVLRVIYDDNRSYDPIYDSMKSMDKSFKRIKHIIFNKQDTPGPVKVTLKHIELGLERKEQLIETFLQLNTQSRESKKVINQYILRIHNDTALTKRWPEELKFLVDQLADVTLIFLQKPSNAGLSSISNMTKNLSLKYPKQTVTTEFSLLQLLQHANLLQRNDMSVDELTKRILNLNLMNEMNKFQRAYDNYYLAKNEQANNYRILLFLTSVLFFLIIVRFFMKIHLQAERLRQEIQEKKLAEAALRTHRDNLEKIVHQRTMELSDANVSLAQEMEERELAESEKTKLKRELDRSKKLGAIGVLASGIAQDFNGHLNAILTNINELKNVFAKDKKVSGYLDVINDSAEHAAELTNLLLDFSSKAPHDRDLINLNDITLEARNFLQANIDDSLTIKTQLAEDLWMTRGDGSQILQVFVDLGLNSRDAMPHGGEITFISQNFILDEILAKYYSKLEPGNYVQISVIDTGEGIPEDIIDNIFDPYFTTKDSGKGTGLGLSQVYGIIEAHNAAIRVYSHQGRGTVFHIYFPAYTEEELRQELPVDKDNVETDDTSDVVLDANILIIDDERSMREIAKTILEEQGARVWTATDGYEGWKYYESHGDELDITILDMRLPTMSGVKAFDRIRDFNPKAKILFSSGYPETAEVESLRKKGNVDFIAKPFSRDLLISKIQQMLESTQSE